MRIFAVLVLAALAAGASAQPVELSGTIGGLPVFLDLSRNGDAVSGWYFYLKVGKQLRLAGKLDRTGFFQIDEYTADTNTRTGAFTGRIRDGRWSGTWRNAAGKNPLGFDLSEVKGTLADADGRFKCTTRRRDTQFGYTYTQRIDLTLANGRVKTLKLFRGEKSADGDDQSCQIGLGDLKQVGTENGILLRARGEKRNAPSHCTVRMLGAGDYLVIKIGDPLQSGNDCRGADDAVFCSPRSFWADLIVNRTTQSCRPVQ